MNKEIKAYLSKLGKKGGKNRMKSMTKEERKALSRKGHEARWGYKQQNSQSK